MLPLRAGRAQEHRDRPRGVDERDPAGGLAGAGAIINMGSVSWMRGRPKLAGCTAAKAGIVTDRQTALHRDLAADQAFLDAQCLKVRLNAGHVSRVTLFMASDDSNGMTGQHVLVDAGIAQCSVMG